MESSEDAPVLAGLMELGPAVRRALHQLATRPSHQRGIVDVIRDLHPAEFESPVATDDPCPRKGYRSGWLAWFLGNLVWCLSLISISSNY